MTHTAAAIRALAPTLSVEQQTHDDILNFAAVVGAKRAIAIGEWSVSEAVKRAALSAVHGRFEKIASDSRKGLRAPSEASKVEPLSISVPTRT